MNDDLHKLIADLKAGDSEAQHQFWQRHWSWLQRIAAEILDSAPDGADVTSDVLCAFMMEHVHRLRFPDATRSYLRLLTIRAAIKYRNKRNRYYLTDVLDGRAPPTDRNSELNAEQWAQMIMLYPALSACLAALRPKAQQAIRLRYGQEMTTQEIGETLGGTKQYIGRLLNQSLELLRKCVVRAQKRREGNKHEAVEGRHATKK